jgi:hypothetical protein
MNPTSFFSRGLALCSGVGAWLFLQTIPLHAAAEPVKITEQPGKLRVEIGGNLFTEYCYEGVPRPFLYPILGPGGAPMTRNWPMKTVADEEHDHPHHKSLWFTHGDVNGIDFWSDGENKGKIKQVKLLKVGADHGLGTIHSSNHWVAPDGKLILTDQRTWTFARQGEETTIDFVITMFASQGEVKFGDTKEGSMALRLAETMRLKGKVGKGHIVNSEGVRDDLTWGKRAAWCDYYGPVNGKIVGVAIFDHPQNPRYPTWWHVRDYGLFAANPFGLHDFEKKPAGAGDLVVPSGQSITFRYRLYFHPGNESEGRVADHYQAFSAEKY